MHAAATHTESALQSARKNGWLRAGDLAGAGIPRVVLTRRTASGQLERAARGLYRLPDSRSSGHEGLVTVARKVPQAVICLLSALQFHGLTTQLPWQVWIAMPRGSPVPRLDHPPIKMVQFTGEAYTHGLRQGLPRCQRDAALHASGGVSAPGRPEGEHRSAQHQGIPMTRDCAASVRARLLNVVKATGTDFNLVLVRFALERLWSRLSIWPVLTASF